MTISKTRSIAALGAAAAFWSGAALADASVEAAYDVSADRLWALLDFHQPSEVIMPPIESSAREGEGIGAIKINQLKGGGEVRLQLVHYAPDERAFNYVIRSSPLPVADYVGAVRVTDLGEGRASFRWAAVYDPDGVPGEKADEILQGFLESIAARIGEITAKE